MHYNLIAHEWLGRPYQTGKVTLAGNVYRAGPGTERHQHRQRHRGATGLDRLDALLGQRGFERQRGERHPASQAHGTHPLAERGRRLRDPRRAQERFVSGRLARILRALEQRIEQSLPDHLDEVAFRSAAGWRFNHEILSLLPSSGDVYELRVRKQR